MLAGLGHHFGWSRAELEALTDQDLLFWSKALADWHEAVKAQQGK